MGYFVISQIEDNFIKQNNRPQNNPPPFSRLIGFPEIFENVVVGLTFYAIQKWPATIFEI